MLLFDVAPVAGGIGLLAAGAFFLILAAAAFVTFKMLKRTVKMAVRVGLVVVILTIAVAGSIALWAFSRGSSDRPRPPVPARNR